MAWVRLDDQMPEHPKFDALSDSAFRLHIHGLSYCARQLTDGFIGFGFIGRLLFPDDDPVLEQELVDAGVWERTSAGYRIPEYLENNPSKEEVLKDRATQRMRQRARKQYPAVFSNCGNFCVKCGSTQELQVDHVIPIARGGTNDLDNLQILCGPCNRRKGARI